METRLVKQEPQMMAVRDSLSADDVIGQVKLIQKVLDGVMQENVHYGKIPGCGPKPTLLKAGAEKLCLTFRLAPQFVELPGSSETDSYVCYKIKCDLVHIPTGDFRGSGLGVCNSKERKYRSSSPLDIQNTIYKMACKRALVAAVLVSTAASDIFTQDLEDMPSEPALRTAPSAKPIPKPREFSPPPEDTAAAFFDSVSNVIASGKTSGSAGIPGTVSSAKPIIITVEGDAIKVINWPFMKKDTIKDMGYQWEQATKSWVTRFSDEELERIQAFSKDFE